MSLGEIRDLHVWVQFDGSNFKLPIPINDLETQETHD